MSLPHFRKYPRIPHVSGSALQPGDDHLALIPVDHLAGRPGLVVEENLDGANCGIWFDQHSRLQLQSRGHLLRGGPTEEQFALFKRWAAHWTPTLRSALGSHLVLYGEWLHAKHTVFYDRLPHFLVEFDVWDRRRARFLPTDERHQLLAPLPVVSAPVLHRGPLPARTTLTDLVTASRFCSGDPLPRLVEAALATGLDPALVVGESETAGQAEGLYLKVEDDRRVIHRAKLVRRGFRQEVDASGSHWMTHPLVHNRLADGVDLFAPLPGGTEPESER